MTEENLDLLDLLSSMPSEEDGKEVPAHIVHKRAARLAAIQLLYSTIIDEKALDTPAMMALVAQQILDFQSGKDDDEALAIEPDMAFLEKLVTGVREHEASLDALYIPLLSDKWRPERLDPVLRSVLRAGTYELKYIPDIPASVIVDEYTSLTGEFYENNDIGFVNGVLDKVAKQVRG